MVNKFDLCEKATRMLNVNTVRQLIVARKWLNIALNYATIYEQSARTDHERNDWTFVRRHLCSCCYKLRLRKRRIK